MIDVADAALASSPSPAAQQIWPNLLIVDVRDAVEFAAGSIIGARKVPHDHAILVQVA
ncbi:hypothetical protein WME94_17220 [Sorangium sp. So ce429]